MRPILFVFVLLLSSFTAFSQLVKVLDFGEIYSTYDWSAESKAELRADLGDVLAEKVITLSNEAAWPKGIADLAARAQNRARMDDYIIFYLTTVKEHIAILFVPAIENRGMPEDMRPKGDIYFLIGLRAVDMEADAEESDAGDASGFQSAEGFAAQLDQIVQDYPNDFINLIGELLEEDGENLSYTYASYVNLEGSTMATFYEDLYYENTSYHADFPGSEDHSEGLKTYYELIRRIETTNLSSCSLLKAEEYVDGRVHHQSFSAYDPGGNLGIGFQGMVVGVYLAQGEVFDEEGQLVSYWYPVLSVYKE